MKGRLSTETFRTASDAGYSRLHITPLDPSLLKVIVPAAVLPHARHISYHTLQAFPEKPYGFVDLPTADAEKIKKKLNGAVLRGNKIRIEPARPDDMAKPSPDAIMDEASIAKTTKAKAEKKEKKEKKRKRDPQDISGIELEEGRKVKRGWTVTPEEAQAKKEKERKEEKRLAKSKKSSKDKSKDDKKKKKKKEPESLYSDKPECLVKTRLPPNRLDLAEGKKSKKSKTRDTVVHEFEKNTKFATFLKATPADPTSGKETTSFVEGKGWTRDDGTVVEEVKSTRPKEFPKMQVSKSKVAVARADPDDDTSSSEGSSASESEDDGDSSSAEGAPHIQLQATPTKQPAISIRPGSAASATETASARPESSSSARSLTIKIPPSTPASSSTKVHPLEALYKKSKEDETSGNDDAAKAEPFSFFGGLAEEEGEGEDGLNGENGDLGVNSGDENEPSQGPQLPMTPFTKQDFEWRNMRSAAPTPDTAHPSRMSRIWPLRGDDEDGLEDVQEDAGEDEEDGDEIMAGYSATGGSGDATEGATNPSTDFQKWFWEHRGDLNRSWKKRRKTAAKEKRYRENKARADRAI